MMEMIESDDYRQWIVSVKQRVQAAQLKAAVAVNQQLLDLYWYLGNQILEKQRTAAWGDGFLPQMSKDLLSEFPEMKGFSHRNLKSIRQWYRFWTSAELAELMGKQAVSHLPPIGKQAVSQLPAVTTLGFQEQVKQLVSRIFPGDITS